MFLILISLKKALLFIIFCIKIFIFGIKNLRGRARERERATYDYVYNKHLKWPKDLKVKSEPFSSKEGNIDGYLLIKDSTYCN